MNAPPAAAVMAGVKATVRTEVKSTCCYCGVGCGVLIETDGKQVTGVRGDPQHPANFGRLCTKGSTLHLTASPLLQQQARALYPELRTTRSGVHNGVRTRASWDDTLDFIAQKFADTIAKHGPDSVGFYVSGQLLTEDYYVFNKLAKGLIGTNNIDSNSRLCMSSAVAGYKQTLGMDAPPTCYEDIEQADLIFIVGSNTAYAHPILYRRIEEAKKNNPKLKVIVADPRRTDTAREADLYLPILPGTDVALFNGLLRICLWEGLFDIDYINDHTEGFEELRTTVREYTPAFVAATCGITEADLYSAARWFGQARAALSLYCQGLNQSVHGTQKNAALINLHLATHQIGKPGAGPFSLTGQPNAMGGRETGGMANLLSAHRDLANPDHRAEVAALWGVDDVPATPGKTAVEMFDAVLAGDIKIIWIVCTNPAQSMPDQKRIRAALNKAELVIVQEACKNTASVAYADVLLPATTWSEKDGSVTNSERRITRVKPVLPPPGETRHDWQIAIDFARKLEDKLFPSGRLGKVGKAGTIARRLFPYQTSEQIWNEHRETTRGRDLDITGLSYAILEKIGPQQWPYRTGATAGTPRLYEDGVFPTASGRARFVNTSYAPPAEPIDARYPFHLNTGRLRDQWHGMSRTGTVPQLFAHAAEPAVLMAAADMQRQKIAEGDLVYVTSRRGMQVITARASEEMQAGQAFIGMHWGEEYLSGRGQNSSASIGSGGSGNGGSSSPAAAASFGVNTVTLSAFDPTSKQPELKHAAVKIMKAELPWRYVVFGWIAPEHAVALQAALRPAMRQFAYASCVLFGRERTGVLFRAADDYAGSPALLQEIEAQFGIAESQGQNSQHNQHNQHNQQAQGVQILRYDDIKRGNARHIAVKDGALAAVALAGDTAAEEWLRQYLEQGLPVAALGRALLSPSAKAPQGLKSRGRIICNCLNVSETEITTLADSLAGPSETVLAAVQQKLKCGTNCGSCVPEVKRMVWGRKPGGTVPA